MRSPAEYETAGMRIITSKSEAMVFHWRKVASFLQVSRESLSQVEGQMEHEIGRWIGAALAVMQSLYRTVVELSREAKLWIY